MPRSICLALLAFFVFMIAGCSSVETFPVAASQSPTPTPSTSPSPSPSPTPVPAEAMIYIVVEGEAVHTAGATVDLRGFALRNGSLEAIGNPDLSLVPYGIDEMTVSPRGRALYLISANSISSSMLHVFNIGLDGLLSEVQTNSFPMGFSFAPMVSDPAGRFLFATADDGLHEYKIDAETDRLSEVAGSPFPVGGKQFARGAVLSPDGKFLYVSDPSTATWGFTLDANTGQLTELPGNPVLPRKSQATDVDPSGAFLYAFDGFTASKLIGRIEPDGTLQIIQDTQNAQQLNYNPFNPFAHTVYAPTDQGDLVYAKLQTLRLDPADGSLHALPDSPLLITEDVELGCGHNVSQTFVSPIGDRIYLTTWQGLYVLPLDVNGNPHLPSLAHVSIARNSCATVGKIVVVQPNRGP